MGRACGRYGREEKIKEFGWDNMKGRTTLKIKAQMAG
jgi:hypothetical protein